MKMKRSKASITEKIVLRGRLHLDSPLMIGAGENPEAPEHEVNTYVLRDKKNKPFIPGTSLAGVLRAEMLKSAAIDEKAAEILFGRIAEKEMEEAFQSAIDISDVSLSDAKIITRDGVSIDSFTGTAIKQHKYDYEAVERGSTGNLEIIITLRENSSVIQEKIHDLVRGLVRLLGDGLRLGAGTAKGFGRVSCKPVYALGYIFQENKSALKAWLEYDGTESIDDWRENGKALHLKNYKAEGKAVVEKNLFCVDAWFALRSSLIVRSGDTKEAEQRREMGNEGSICAVQLKSGADYVIPGTTMKGVLRHQAEKIITLFGQDTKCLGQLMGYSDDETGEKQKSRFFVDDVYIAEEAVSAAAQSRNRIDRFTGGTMDTALFTTEPIWKKEQTEAPVKLHFEIHECSPEAAGLALFLLRDLWQGRVAIGGEKSIGRGTLAGKKAKISYHCEPYQDAAYEMDADGKLVGGLVQQQALEGLAKRFFDRMNDQEGGAL